MSKIQIFGLGGLNENGKNMYVVDVDDSIFVFDAGLKHEEGTSLGIDYIIPNFDYLINNKERIKGIFLTHGHSENMGATADIIEKLPEVPVYATKLTMAILKQDLEESNITNHNLKEIKAHYKIEFGNDLSVFPISVTHSIPDAVCYVLYTKDGAIVYTGDFVFDSTMRGFYKTDIGKLAYVGKQGVLALLSESYYAEKPGYTSPKNRARDFIGQTIRKHDDRIVMNIKPAHLYRIQEIFDEVSKTHRKVVIMGKNLQDTVNNSLEMGYLTFDKNQIGDLSNLEDKGIIVLISDTKEQPFANLHRIVKGFDKYIKLKDTDLFFITEPSSPSTEKNFAFISDEIAMKNASAITLPSRYLSHHPSTEDLMLMIDLMNPKYYFPVKGEYRHLFENGKVAQEVGIAKENIFIRENGNVVTLIDGNLSEDKYRVETGDILIDGTSQADVGSLVLKDREMIGENGIVIISCTLSRETKELLTDVEVLTRGFIYVKENGEIIEETKRISREQIEKNIVLDTKKVDYTQIKNDVREKLGRYFYHETESKPMIITVIQEV